MDPSRKKQAVALRYEPKKDRAPKITGEGRGYLAEKILDWRDNTTSPFARTKTFCRFFPASISIRKCLPRSTKRWLKSSPSFTA